MRWISSILDDLEGRCALLRLNGARCGLLVHGTVAISIAWRDHLARLLL